MDDETRKERLADLRADTGMGPREKGETSEAVQRLTRTLSESEERHTQEGLAEAVKKEVKASEIRRLGEAIASLGLSREDFVNHFPAISENYIRVCRERFLNGFDIKSIDGKNEELLYLHFSAIISLLESDEQLAQEISSRWGQELVAAIAAHDEDVAKRTRS